MVFFLMYDRRHASPSMPCRMPVTRCFTRIRIGARPERFTVISVVIEDGRCTSKTLTSSTGPDWSGDIRIREPSIWYAPTNVSPSAAPHVLMNR